MKLKSSRPKVKKWAWWVLRVSILRAVTAKPVTPGHEAGENQKNLVQEQIFHGHEKPKIVENSPRKK